MIEQLRNLQAELKSLKKAVSDVKTAQVAKISIRNKAEDIGTRWFSEFSEQLVNENGLSPDVIEKYSRHFGRLIKISSPNNLKKSYIEALQAILKPFRDELIIPLQTQPKEKAKASLLADLLKDLPLPSENEYLQEAIECARHNYYRASVVLGWCATIDRIHHVLENAGFQKFNVTSSTMASQNKGRFKRFSSVQNVSSISEIREVFDTIVLWILEGMSFIDSNQHTRLRSCFDLRCQCAHPGDAPVTEYNLLSYFSDLNEIVLKNEKFNIKMP